MDEHWYRIAHLFFLAGGKERLGIISHSSLRWLWLPFFANDWQGLLDFVGDYPGATGLRINKHPIGFGLRHNRFVASTDELVFAQRMHFSEVGNPRQNGDRIAGNRRAEIFDMMGSHHPCCAQR
jgi:hypothetical protein